MDAVTIQAAQAITMTEILKTGAIVLVPFLIAVIGFFLVNYVRQMQEDNAAQSELITKLTTSFSTMEKDMVVVKKDLERMVEISKSVERNHEAWVETRTEVERMKVEINSLKKDLNEVVISNREQNRSVWKRIDEIHTQVGSLRNERNAQEKRT